MVQQINDEERQYREAMRSDAGTRAAQQLVQLHKHAPLSTAQWYQTLMVWR
jgi:hypothetical protein